MPRPNYFIVGAPKCGTTALSEYLREHPNVFVSHQKEPHYFATDFPNNRAVNSEEAYLRLFDGATPEHTAVGEASVFYLYSKTAIENIKQYDSAARIIVMFRNPVELVHSMHSQLLYSKNEDVRDFTEAWALVPERKRGFYIPQKCKDSKLLYYDEIARLGEQYQRLKNLFPQEQVKVIFFEDFVKNPAAVYKDILNYIGVPDDGRTDFPRLNNNKKHRLAWLGSFTQRPPGILVNLSRAGKSFLGINQLGILPALRRINQMEFKRDPLPKGIRQHVIEQYYDDILLLSRLTSRDLSHWAL